MATLSARFGSRGSFFAYWIFHCYFGCRIPLVHACRTRHYVSISHGDVSRCSYFSRSDTRSPPAKMLPQKQAEEAIVMCSSTTAKDELEQDVVGKEDEEVARGFSMKSFLWHGGSVWDAWFSCASNQVLPSLLFDRNRRSW